MMNKKVLALAVAGITSAGTVNAAEIYKDNDTTLNMGGRIEVRANFSDANKSDTDDNSFKDASRARLHIDGTHKLNDDVNFLGKMEFEITEDNTALNASDDTNWNTRYLFAGVESKRFGKLTYGHQDNAVTYLTNFTDMAETFSGYINEYNASTSDRASNVLNYTYALDSLTIQANIQADSDADSMEGNNADGYGLMASYAFTKNLEVGLGYASNDANYDTYTDDQNTSNTYLAAIKYMTDAGLYLAATYQGGTQAITNNSDTDFNAADAYVGYNFNNSNVNLTYNYYDVDDNSDAAEALNVNNVGLEYAHYYGNATVYASYLVNMLDSDSVANSDNQTQLGLRYAF